MTPLAQRLRDAADTVAELNALHGYQGAAVERATVSPVYLREQAERMEAHG